MYEFEEKACSQGHRLICGVDEAGRGPLAGPVFAAAVIFPLGIIIDGVNDSKKLSENKRLKLFDIIKEKALSYCVAWADVSEIDDINILNAALLAMRRAVAGLSCVPDIILADGDRDPCFGIKTWTIKGGDGKSASIAAASILAKVSRDKHMLELDLKYPEYQFKKHKGYGTKLHYQMLEAHGACGEHRRSFNLGSGSVHSRRTVEANIK